MQTIVFYIFASTSILGAILVVSRKNPVASVLSLVLTLFSTAVLFILLFAHFLALIQVLIYAGAIMVLFLFTVMFLNLRDEYLRFDALKVPVKIGILLLILLISVYCMKIGLQKNLPLNTIIASHPEPFGTVEGVGEVLFSDYLLPFELTSVLIVVAIVGVVVIAKRRVD
ncbi:MAG TPA: NADH-quinone oxidoreductase subunit J [Thermodesulfobacteriota bacterium]